MSQDYMLRYAETGNTTNAQRIRRYKARMLAAGFHRLNVWIHPDLLAFIKSESKSYECYGRTLERLLLGESRPRNLTLEINDSEMSNLDAKLC